MYVCTYICIMRMLRCTSLYTRYSSKVDMYVSKISACLKDESMLVRKQTLTLLTHLLQVSHSHAHSHTPECRNMYVNTHVCQRFTVVLCMSFSGGLCQVEGFIVFSIS